MKAITVQQPFAWAIAEGHKTVENRGQNVNYRGHIAIHAGLAVSALSLPDQQACAALDQLGGRGNVWDPRHFPAPLHRPANTPTSLALGSVIAVAELVDCHEAAGGCCAPWGAPTYLTKRGVAPARHLVLANVRRLSTPVPCRGEVRVAWELPASVAAMVDAQLAEAATR